MLLQPPVRVKSWRRGCPTLHMHPACPSTVLPCVLLGPPSTASPTRYAAHASTYVAVATVASAQHLPLTTQPPPPPSVPQVKLVPGHEKKGRASKAAISAILSAPGTAAPQGAARDLARSLTDEELVRVMLGAVRVLGPGQGGGKKGGGKKGGKKGGGKRKGGGPRGGRKRSDRR